MQKICLVAHIHRVADILYVDAMQQLEVALLSSPASGLIDLLAERLPQSPFLMKPTVQPPHVYTSSPSAPPPPTIPIVGVTTSMPEKTSDDKTDKSVTTAPGPQEAPQNVSKHDSIVPTLATTLYIPSTSSTFSSYPIAMVSELVILTDAYPEYINRPGGGKDHLCCLCSFHHTNYECMLTHIRKQLNITMDVLAVARVSRMLLHYTSLESRFIRYKSWPLLRK